MAHVAQVASRAYVVHVAAAAKPKVTDKMSSFRGFLKQMAATICISPLTLPYARPQLRTVSTVCRIVS
jgi:hypothetical protein